MSELKNELIERMRAQKAEHEAAEREKRDAASAESQAIFDRSAERGRQWAMAEATYDQMRRLAEAVDSRSKGSVHGIRVIEKIVAESACHPENEHAFTAGAMEVWADIKDQI